MNNRIWQTIINFTDENGTSEQINGLFATYVRGATQKINRSRVLSAFSEQQGVIQDGQGGAIVLRFDPDAPQGVALTFQPEFSAETHPTTHDLDQEPISAEWTPPTPDSPAISELLPTLEALQRLLAVAQTDEAVVCFRPNQTVTSQCSFAAYTHLDPYAMAWATIDSAVRALVALGIPLGKIVLMTQFNEQAALGELIRCTQACHDATVAYRTPIIDSCATDTGDSLFTVTAIGTGASSDSLLPQKLTKAGNLLYIVGDTKAEMGGNRYALLHGEEGGIVPQGLTEGLMRYRSLHRTINKQFAVSCRPILAGGLGVALAQMALGSELGADIALRQV
ncbi:MAG: hypothetical protein ACPG8W_25340, partial [Candidatus Promineifilaceae bacterium]